MPDPSNGYEALAAIFIRDRYPEIGKSVVRHWAGTLAPAADVLELGCGHGVITEVLIESGLAVSAVDASPSLLGAFRQRFPHVPNQCAAAEESDFFGRTFDGIIAIGLLFLLAEEAQRTVLRKAASALRPGGHLLFTAPHQQVEWIDILTRQPSRSLGAPAYQAILSQQGLQVSWGITDEGENHYFLATKPPLSPSL
jgi:2-polyprenyl-3-methyl-5-hydroxy-6-metoxy-1,4-benzoquinol methylase